MRKNIKYIIPIILSFITLLVLCFSNIPKVIAFVIPVGLIISIGNIYINNRKEWKPVDELYDALKNIDFDSSIVDFTALDNLKVDTKSDEILDRLTVKTKYLADIITSRINDVNYEVFKAEHDELSGCYNRQHLDRVKSYYEENKFAIIFIDVNNLKRMNDEFGHEAGDNLLKNAANKLSFWNTYGDVYRMGGDEFMIVTTNITEELMNEYINEWYPTVGQLNRETDPFKCVLSYGVAFGTVGDDFGKIQKIADDRMYEMKIQLKKKFGEPLSRVDMENLEKIEKSIGVED